MNYQKIYNDLIAKRKEFPYIDGYSERHHILPRSLGGSDDKDNLVQLSAKEHYIAHLLLCKIYENDKSKFYKIVKAFVMMSASPNGDNSRYFNSNTYKLYKEEFSKAMSESQMGCGNSQYGTQWIYNNDLRESKKIPKSEKIPEGWLKGRIQDFSYLDRCCIKCNIHLELTEKSNKSICKKCNLSGFKFDENFNLENEFKNYFKIFKNGNFKSLNEFAKNYKLTPNTFNKYWKLYIVGYSDLCKKRINMNSNKVKHLNI